MELLEQYDFVDCLLTDFDARRDFRSIEIKCEAQFPLGATESSREKGIISIRLTTCTAIKLTARKEFWVDLARAYNDGDTFKANEIQEISLTKRPGGTERLVLRSDMLDLYVECEASQISRGN